MIIQHNIMSLNAHRQLGGNTSLVSKNLEKLSSGFKINRAGDDAAGLAISEKMRAQITGLTRAQSNAQDGISLVQTAEGALTEVHSMLNRMVDLATQSSNGTMQSDDRQKIQDEMDSLTGEIDRISKSTNFNGINLLDGSLGGAGNTPKVSAATIAGATVAISETQATASKHTVTIADGGTNTGNVALDITYVGADGKDVKVSVGAYAPGADVALTVGTKALVDAINNDAKLNGLFTASMKADGSELYLTSKATGKAALEIKSVSNTNTTTPALAVTTSSATNTVASADRTFSVGMGALAAGDAITIDGKTYEFLADPTTAKKGNIGVQFTTDLAGSLTAFNAELKKNGVVATNAGGTVSFTSDPAATAKGLVLHIGDTAEEVDTVAVA
ncbi:MAG: flagellin, partial [Angelakisella sp.]